MTHYYTIEGQSENNLDYKSKKNFKIFDRDRAVESYEKEILNMDKFGILVYVDCNGLEFILNKRFN